MASNDYTEAKTRALGMIDEYLGTEKWDSCSESSGILFKRTKHKEGHPMDVFYGSKILNASIEDIVHFAWHSCMFEKLKQFDDNIVDFQFIDIGEEDRVVYQVSKLPWPLSSRSVVSNWFVHRKEDATILVYTGVTHPDFPDKPSETVRACVNIAAMHLTPTSDGKTRLQRLLHFDPSGSLPAALVNRLGGRQIVDYILWLEKELTHK